MFFFFFFRKIDGQQVCIFYSWAGKQVVQEGCIKQQDLYIYPEHVNPYFFSL